MIDTITKRLTDASKKNIGRLILLLISCLVAVAVVVFYTHYIDRDMLKRGPISLDFWRKLYLEKNPNLPEEERFRVNNIYPYLLNPGVNLTYWGNETLLWPTSVIINQAGFRDHDYTVKKPDDIFRIVLLGDSLTFGLGINLEDSVAKVLERLLNQHGRKYEVLNGGLPDSSGYLQYLFFKRTLAKYHPDIVLWFYSPKDFNCLDIKTANEIVKTPYFHNNAKKLSAWWDHLRNDRGLSDDTLQMRLFNFQNNLQPDFVPKLLDICIRMPLLELKGLTESIKSRLVYIVFDENFLNGWVIAEYVKGLNVPVNFNQEYVRILTRHPLRERGDGHLSAEGHRLLGRRLFEHLNEHRMIGEQDR